jgi:hypothetical protein
MRENGKSTFPREIKTADWRIHISPENKNSGLENPHFPGKKTTTRKIHISPENKNNNPENPLFFRK